MPVTVHPAPHSASLLDPRYDFASTPDELLAGCSHAEYRSCTKIIQSSFADLDGSRIKASANGFVHSVIEAYNHHHHLTIRPDDVWLAILTQLNIYINAHETELRHKFVTHEGQKELEIIDIGTASTYNWGGFAQNITKMIENNIIDAELREWIIPDFTTTTEKDKVVCSIVMMSTLQKYFSYKCSLKCGLPSVTLQGEKADWERILSRLGKLTTFGSEAADWYKLLVPVIEAFINTYNKPDSEEIKDIWQKIAHESGGGSGPTYLSGWITAFCFWDEEGSNLHARDMRWSTSKLSLGGVAFHKVDMDDIAPGWAAVPVKVNDNGVEFDARMVAWHVGMSCDSSGQRTAEGEIGLDSVQREVGWWMFRVEKDCEINEENKVYPGLYKGR